MDFTLQPGLKAGGRTVIISLECQHVPFSSHCYLMNLLFFKIPNKLGVHFDLYCNHFDTGASALDQYHGNSSPAAITHGASRDVRACSCRQWGSSDSQAGPPSALFAITVWGWIDPWVVNKADERPLPKPEIAQKNARLWTYFLWLTFPTHPTIFFKNNRSLFL